MAPFGDGGGREEEKGGDARWAWDQRHSGIAPPTIEGAATAAAGDGIFGGGGGGGGGSFFSGMDGLGARNGDVRWRRGTVTQEHFGNSTPLSNGLYCPQS
ncbi:hypothetical protein GUJ93_ZPchr0004g38251 [Zizania palustris]|uniref:Uncharacterized protein n=1 Tax=Zizania palustris TaxID=103762 RepID=A0A8J5RWD2_ZIZPA|nr:hypothetical protein GUJ93_ZPchr0004g38251 [Zizania palustris]